MIRAGTFFQVRDAIGRGTPGLISHSVLLGSERRQSPDTFISFAALKSTKSLNWVQMP